MKGIYLASFQALHPSHEIVYQDINGKRDIPGDMMEIDLTPYDYIIATPPCNYWSRANWRRYTSEYSQKTKHLLPSIIKKLSDQTKPFIIENVMNMKMFQQAGLFDYDCLVYVCGRHVYWTNQLLDLRQVHQIKDDIRNSSKNNRQGGYNVHQVIEVFIKTIKDRK